MKAIVTLIFTLAIFSAQANFLSEVKDVNWPFIDCGSSSDDLDVTQVTLASNPAKGTGAAITVVRQFV